VRIQLKAMRSNQRQPNREFYSNACSLGHRLSIARTRIRMILLKKNGPNHE
jgi:hypothetical protein